MIAAECIAELEAENSCLRADNATLQEQMARLLERVQVLTFLDDVTIPFENNQAEHDLRSFKVQQKISGCLRSDPGAVTYVRLRGYLATLRKQGRALLAALQTVAAGHPVYPEFAGPVTLLPQ